MPPTPEESAQAFRARALRARADRERHEAETRIEVVARLRALLPPGARAWLVGSLAWGGFGERSDVDLVLDGVTPVIATQIEEGVARVAGVSVDILRLDDLPESFRRRVEHDGLLIRGC